MATSVFPKPGGLGSGPFAIVEPVLLEEWLDLGRDDIAEPGVICGPVRGRVAEIAVADAKTRSKRRVVPNGLVQTNDARDDLSPEHLGHAAIRKGCLEGQGLDCGLDVNEGKATAERVVNQGE